MVCDGPPLLLAPFTEALKKSDPMSDLTYFKTGDAELDRLVPAIRGFLEMDNMDLVIDGTPIRGYRSPDAPSIWIRDHSDMMRGFRHFEGDLQSAVTHFAETQGMNGRIFDYFTTSPEKVPCEKENWAKYVRVPVEADVEYRFIKAAFLAWQATGDDDWIERLIPHMEKALEYSFSHPWRWDPERQLVKRAYTIDSWDFAYSAGRHDWLQFQIDDHTFWGILHGDNSGFYEACLQLARIYRYFENTDRAAHWEQFAHGLKTRMNAVCWNGKFYTHFVKLSPVTIEGVDEAAQLSFSNAMNINRGVATHEQAVSILREYQARREQDSAFAEWFSIHPPFPDGVFGDDKIVGGAYCNGGIMPLVGGELARAYLENGMESAGVRTLRQYSSMIAEKNETFLWYFPDGEPSSIDKSTSPDAQPTDGWGSSSMLYGAVEGLAGVQDRGRLFSHWTLCPRWHFAGVREAEVGVGYAASNTGVRYSYQETDTGIRVEVEAPDSTLTLALPVPADAASPVLQAGGADVEAAPVQMGDSHYLRATIPLQGGATIRLDW